MEPLTTRRWSLKEPDAHDPLNGVIDVTGDFGQLQIVSFAGKIPALINDALREAELCVRQDSALKLAPLPHLIALKLYAGGSKSKGDIVELLLRNPEADLERVRNVCKSYRLGGLDELIAEARSTH